MFGYLGRKIHQSWMVVFLCLGIIFGIIIGLVFRISFFGVVWWGLVSILLFLFTIFNSRRFLMIIALMAGMILAFFRISTELYAEDYTKQFYDQTVVVSGEIGGDPETDEGGTKYKLLNLRFGESGEYKVNGSLYVSGYKNENLARGDRMKLSGKLAEGFGTYMGYLYRPVMVDWKKPEPGDLVLKIRNWFADKVKVRIPEPEVNLGLSYLLGMRSGLPDELSENLRTVGLVHIVVASGAHLSILVEIARKIFGKLSRFSGLLFSILFIVFFMTMVGFTPSILRAGIMSILTIVAWYGGRKIEAWRSIILVAALTLMINPMFIIDLGWLLSFASYGGIMILGPILTKFFYGEKKPGFIGSIILTTISATLMTLPIILFYYGQISLISVFANLLILPTLPYAMGLTFLAGVLSNVPGVNVVIGFLTTKILDYHIIVVEFFGSMKSFLIKIETGRWQVFLIYLIILVVLCYRFWIDRKKMRIEFELKEE